MRTIERTGAFRRDLKRELKGRHARDVVRLLGEVVGDLVADRSLPIARRDHSLTGDWSDHRDCHLRPDRVPIYRPTGDDVLSLVRLGSHSELKL